VIDEHVFFFSCLGDFPQTRYAEGEPLDQHPFPAQQLRLRQAPLKSSFCFPPFYAFSSASESASRFPKSLIFQGSARLRNSACRPADWLLPCGLLEACHSQPPDLATDRGPGSSPPWLMENYET